MLRFTYDEVADAVFLYFVDDIEPGSAKRSRMMPLDLKGTSIMVVFGEADRAVGAEFLGASRMFTSEALDAFRAGRSAFRSSGPS